MRKLSLLLIIAALLMVNIVPSTYAQDEQPTIAEVLQARADSDTPEFTMFLAALQAADPFLWERISDPEMAAATFTTVFAPTDEAFTAALAALGMTAEEVMADSDVLTAVLAHHVVPGIFTAENFAAKPGALWGTFVPHDYLIFAQDGDTLTVNGATIVEADIPAFDGAIFVIDQVLLPTNAMARVEEGDAMEPPTETIYDILSTREDFSLFKYAMDQMGFQTDLSVTNYTLFMPTDDVFQAFLDEVGVSMDDFLANTDTSTPILFYHFLSGTFDSDDISTIAEQAADEDVFFGTQQPGTFMTLTEDGVDNAKVVEMDIYATNGVIHVIDTVLLPSGG